MGLQDSPQMAAVPAHAVNRSGSQSARSSETPSLKDQTPGAALEESLLALTLKADEQYRDEEDDVSNNSEDGDDLDYQHELDGAFEDPEDDWEWEADESRLSRALRSWMTDYAITPLPPQGHTLHEPVFSARLGQARISSLQRASSTESLDTQLSLFSCSSHGSWTRKERRRRRLRRRVRPSSSEQRENRRRGQSAEQGSSRWVELSQKRRLGELDRFMMAQSHALSQGVNLIEESEAFQLCEADEQRALYGCGMKDKLKFAAELKKSDSMSNIKEHFREITKKRQQRVTSAGAKKFHGKPIDFQDLHRQMLNQRLAALTTTTTPRSRTSGRRSLLRTHSRHSLSSVSSGEHAFLSARHSPQAGGADTPPLHPSTSQGSGPREGAPPSQQEQQEREEDNVNMWRGDAQILAIDLRRELTSKVKRRIAVTTTALERVTGLGDNNEQQAYTCHLPEFPAFVEEDFAHQPRIPQRIRIAPQLSDIIKSDIKVRMGRPRYHEIREQDLQQWNRGQTLDRAHRNMKVFTWLHSLKEEEFREAWLQQTIHDVPPGVDDVSFGDMVLIRAADEPDIKPLFEQKKAWVH